MGIIARQSFKAFVISYSSVIMGIINQILIYPLFLTVNEYGELQFILQTSVFFTPFILVGLTSVLTKYFPLYSSNTHDKRLLYGVIFLPISINTGLFLLLAFLYRNQISDYLSVNSKVFTISVFVLFSIAALHPWQVVCNTICAIKGRISIPAIFNQSIKAFLPCVVILYYFEIIPFTSVIISLLIFHVSITLIFLLYTSKLETIRPKISLSKFAKVFNLPAMAMFAGFSMFTSVGITLTNQIDVLMITTISGTYDTGLYSWALFCATAVAIPYSILASITTPIISKLWSSDNLFEINKLYKSSSATLLFISLLLFLGLWLVIDDLFIIMPKGIEYSASKPLVLLLCVSKIIDMGTGLNSHILSMSKNYKMLLWFLLGSAVINVGLNYILIPQFGLIGCGTATITSIVFFNLCKFIYIKTKFKIQPFTRNTIHLIACALACYALVFILPKTSNSLINLALYSSLFCGLFAFLTYRLNLSPDVNKFVEKAFNKLTK